METTIIGDIRERVSNGLGGIKSVIRQDTESAKGGVPKQHAIGSVGPAYGNASETLAFKVGAPPPPHLAGAVIGAAIVTNTSK